jgi:glycosyltransferase involved in cell wall biosynthesis
MIEPRKTPKYSILIPTRNREEYLPFAIESVLSQNRDDIELIVSDNYSKDGTSNYLTKLSDSRVRVVMPPSEISMTGHYEFILSQAAGEWVTILGDDDAVMPYLFERLDSIINKHNNISIISSCRAYYFWEGCEDLYGDTVVSYHKGSGIKIRSTKKDLLYALAGLRSCFNMPMIYTSCVVKKTLITEIKVKSGGYFYHSIIPDMYSVVALTLVADSYIRVQEPLFWTGTSNKSMGRSDRIYKDSEIAPETVDGGNDRRRILRLNSDISQELHGAGFTSLYLYEALKQCPLAVGRWHGKFITTIVYASLKLIAGNWIFSKKKINKTGTINIIDSEIKRKGIFSFSVSLCLMVLRPVDFLNKFRLFFPWGWRSLTKLTKIGKNNSLSSSNRENYPNIREASNAVLLLRKEASIFEKKT